MEDKKMLLRDVVYGLKYYYSQASEAEKIVVGGATVAAGASAIGGFIPFFEIPALIISCVGAVWAMYLSICDCLNIPIGKNILKVLASAALSNIAGNLASVFAVELITCMIPGIGSAAGAAATFACVYLAGIMFLNMLLALAKKGLIAKDLGKVSEKDLKSVLADQTPTKESVKEAKNVFKKNATGTT